MRNKEREAQLACEQASGDGGTPAYAEVKEGRREWTAWKLSNTDRVEALDESEWLALGGLLS